LTGTYVRLVLAMVFWGGTFIAAKPVSQELGPYTAAFFRFLMASLVLAALVIHREGRIPALRRPQIMAVVLLGLTGILFYNVLFFSALKTAEAGRAALIIASNPVFIALFSALLFGERIGPVRAAGILLSITGAMIVISGGDMQMILQGELGQSDVYLLGCVFSWVAYTLIGKRVMTGLDPLTAVAYSCIAGTLMLFFPALDEGMANELFSVTPAVLAALSYLAFFGTVLAFVWFYRGVHQIGAMRAGLFINLVPVSAVTLGILILGEKPGFSLLIGGGMILMGLVLTNRPTPGPYRL
jgi:drug/metabolite transporter (DMT)-like permease